MEMQGAKPDTGQAASDEATRLLSPRWCQRAFEAVRAYQATAHHRDQWHPDEDETFWPAVARDAADDATRKAAAVLGVPPIAVALAACALWHWSLTAEREHRVKGSLLLAINPNVQFTDRAQIARDRDWKLSEGEKQVLGHWHVRGTQERALPAALRRKLQAMRGHFTRDLIREMQPLMKDVTKEEEREEAMTGWIETRTTNAGQRWDAAGARGRGKSRAPSSAGSGAPSLRS